MKNWPIPPTPKCPLLVYFASTSFKIPVLSNAIPALADFTWLMQQFFSINSFQELTELNIAFHMLLGEPDKVLPDFVKSKEIGGVVTDFTPMRKPLKWLEDVAEKLPKDVPLCQVCTQGTEESSLSAIQNLYRAKRPSKAFQSDRVSRTWYNTVMRYLFADRLVISYSDNGRLKGDDFFLVSLVTPTNIDICGCRMRVWIRYHQTRRSVNRYHIIDGVVSRTAHTIALKSFWRSFCTVEILNCGLDSSVPCGLYCYSG